MLKPRLYLASQSPRRKALLKQLTEAFSIIVPNIDESWQKGETIEAYVKRITISKATIAWNSVQRTLDIPILAADTAIEIENEILGKPANEQQAINMLKRLSANTHRVVTGICMKHENIIEYHSCCSEVHFCPLSDDTIEQYIQYKEWVDKSGAYAIQGKAGQFVEKISGSYSAIVGLPLHETSVLCQKFSISTL